MLDHIGLIPAAAANKFADKEALIFEGRSFSFNEINDLVERAAGGLGDLGIPPGDTVTLYAANSWEWIVSYYAIARLGAIINPVNTMLTPDEIEYVVHDCGAKATASAEKVEAIMAVHDVSDVSAIVACRRRYNQWGVSLDALIAADLPAPAPVKIDPSALSTIGSSPGRPAAQRARCSRTGPSS